MCDSRLPSRSKKGHQEVSYYVMRAIVLKITDRRSSKRDGLDKAVHRIEEALKKSRTQSEDDQKTFHLRSLLNEAQTILPRQSVAEENIASQYGSSTRQAPIRQASQPVPRSDPQIQDENYSVDDAENPLQLLARASDLSVPTQPTYMPNSLISAAFTARRDSGGDQDLQSFFGPFRPSLDIAEESDPIHIGLVTPEETDTLFT